MKDTFENNTQRFYRLNQSIFRARRFYTIQKKINEFPKKSITFCTSQEIIQFDEIQWSHFILFVLIFQKEEEITELCDLKIIEANDTHLFDRIESFDFDASWC